MHKINGNACIVNMILEMFSVIQNLRLRRVKWNTCMNTDPRMFDETPILLFVNKLLHFLCRVILPETAGSAYEAGSWDSLSVSLTWNLLVLFKSSAASHNEFYAAKWIATAFKIPTSVKKLFDPARSINFLVYIKLNAVGTPVEGCERHFPISLDFSFCPSFRTL